MGPFWVLACKAPITNRLNILVGGWRVFPKFNVKHLTPQAVVAPTCGGPATPDHLGGILDAGSLSPVVGTDCVQEFQDSEQELLKFKMRYCRP